MSTPAAIGMKMGDGTVNAVRVNWDVEAQKDFVEHGFTGLLLKPVTIDKISGIFQNE